MKNFTHLIFTPFTGLGLFNGYRGDEWLKYRIQVFKNCTLKSVLNQEDKDFIHWLTFRPEEKNNPIVMELEEYLKQFKDYKFIITYHGIVLWDDKYPKEVADARLLKSIEGSVKDLEPLIKNRPYVYESILASDDMYHKSTTKDVAEEPFIEHGCLLHEEGYMFDYVSKSLAEYKPGTNPPVYTIMFPTDIYLDPKKHFDYMGPFESHEFVPTTFTTKQLPNFRYISTVHDQNISTVWQHPFRGKQIYYENDKKAILKDYGIELL